MFGWIRTYLRRRRAKKIAQLKIRGNDLLIKRAERLRWELPTDDVDRNIRRVAEKLRELDPEEWARCVNRLL